MKQLPQKILWPKPGRYIVAISGGADSISLLDLLASRKDDYEIVVAHYNDGWEGDDHYEAVAERAAARYGLPFHVHHGKSKHTEAAAREARYSFLRKLLREVDALAIVTAHHLDDLEETVVLNVSRGAGRHGLTPFVRTKDIVRPLVNLRKAELKEYAQMRKLEWCHDVFNDDLSFRRNRVRRELLPELRKIHRGFDARLNDTISEAAGLNQRIDDQLQQLLLDQGRKREHSWEFPREALRLLEMNVLQELLLTAVKDLSPGAELDQRTVESLAVDIKTGRLLGKKPLRGRLSATGARDTVIIVFTP